MHHAQEEMGTCINVSLTLHLQEGMSRTATGIYMVQSSPCRTRVIGYGSTCTGATDISGKVGVSTLCENKKIIPLHILIGLSLKYQRMFVKGRAHMVNISVHMNPYAYALICTSQASISDTSTSAYERCPKV